MDLAPSIKVELRVITPRVAQELLEHNSRNRNLTVNRTRQCADAMRRGEWMFNGDAIRVCDDGTLLDGQHRLAAVIESGIPQVFLIVSGLPAAAQETMDIGKKRSIADSLKLRGETHVHVLAAVGRLVHAYETRQTFRAPTIPPTPQQVLATIDRHPGTREAIRKSRSVAVNTTLTNSVAGACYYLFSRVDAADCEVFFNRLAMGSELLPTSPIFLLRRRFTMPQNSTVRTLSAGVQGALMIKAWNAWRAGEERSLLAWKPGGAMQEKFPVIDGLTPEVLGNGSAQQASGAHNGNGAGSIVPEGAER
jgi:hypothetical protein